MAVRCTSGEVQELLGGDYDTKTPRSLDPFIRTASYIIDDLVADSSWAGSAARAKLIETWLAAHYYTLSDRLLKSKSTGGASGSFVVGKNETPYLDGASSLDPTGELASLVSGQSASMEWLGKTDAEKLTYDERN